MKEADKYERKVVSGENQDGGNNDQALPALANPVEVSSHGHLYEDLVHEIQDRVACDELRGSVCWVKGRIGQAYFDDPRKAPYDILTHYPCANDNGTNTNSHEQDLQASARTESGGREEIPYICRDDEPILETKSSRHVATDVYTQSDGQCG